jgi:hypothetical protein
MRAWLEALPLLGWRVLLWKDVWRGIYAVLLGMQQLACCAVAESAGQ